MKNIQKYFIKLIVFIFLLIVIGKSDFFVVEAKCVFVGGQTRCNEDGQSPKCNTGCFETWPSGGVCGCVWVDEQCGTTVCNISSQRCCTTGCFPITQPCPTSPPPPPTNPPPPSPTNTPIPTNTPTPTRTPTPIPPTSVPTPVACQNFGDDFSGESLNANNWKFISWTNGYGTVSTSGTLNIYLPASIEFGPKSAFVETKGTLSGDFTSEITLVSRNDDSIIQYFQFNAKQYDGGGFGGGFGFRLLNGSLKTEVYGVDNPTNPGPQDHGITIAKDTPVRLKLEKTGTTVKMYYDLMTGQGYQLLRTFNNFVTISGYTIAGIQHTVANLAISGSFDHYSQSCGVVPSPTNNPDCACKTNDNCTIECDFEKIASASSSYLYPIKCGLAPSLFSVSPNENDKNGWCNRKARTRGDADGNGIVNNFDYYYYIAAVFGGKIPQNINPDFNGDGEVGRADLDIYKLTMGIQ
mgnify:CR=1 FL=1